MAAEVAAALVCQALLHLVLAEMARAAKSGLFHMLSIRGPDAY